ncbi:hypothetical protein [uncultured Clostridium sp.]|jgi:sortase (surface protein transpeptidase)|uniref:hypothetical protein n=1 Tax=uncultured Clostridium sp. TaxID=59620 RepID=UPI00272BAF01|nr:hypothetical protein [uncultured Clostridium sp.]
MNKIELKNKKSIMIFICIAVILLISIFVTIIDFLKNNNNEKNNDSKTVSSEANIIEETKNYEIKDLGTVECEKIGLNAPIKETTELDVLSTAVGHFKDTALYNRQCVFSRA